MFRKFCLSSHSFQSLELYTMDCFEVMELRNRKSFITAPGKVLTINCGPIINSYCKQFNVESPMIRQVPFSNVFGILHPR